MPFSIFNSIYYLFCMIPLLRLGQSISQSTANTITFLWIFDGFDDLLDLFLLLKLRQSFSQAPQGYILFTLSTYEMDSFTDMFHKLETVCFVSCQTGDLQK